jgi:hypothetical protein
MRRYWTSATALATSRPSRRGMTTLVVIVVLGRVGISQRPIDHGEVERVAAREVEVLVDQRAQADEDLIGDRTAGGLSLGAGLVHVDRVPEHGRVEDEPERAELILHAFAVALAQQAVVAVPDLAGERVAGLVQVLLGGDHPPVALVVQHLQDVKRLEDAPVVGERVAQPGRAARRGRSSGSSRTRGPARSSAIRRPGACRASGRGSARVGSGDRRAGRMARRWLPGRSATCGCR